ncbi:elongation factor G [Intestinibacillus massiliensis]|uniref:elongation factor G n=1 Tax=Intestinibacillus massiliensis TaxID=1871029 RepID=UPI000B34FB29|nr:elongation factor G [Intestinibacillus massiliensis]
MAIFPVNKIRNVCVMGHGGDGKTSLVESLLFTAGITDRQGRIADGNTVCDFDAEEIKRQFSISTSVAPVEFMNCKINLLDTPGFFDFEGEVLSALRVAESGLIVVPGKAGPSVGTEKAWKRVQDRKMPRMFYISKIDEENSDYYTSLHKLQKAFGVSVCPVVVPIFEGNRETVGVVDCIIRKAYKMEGNERVEIPIPENMAERVDQHRAALCENVAELSEELMERYFAGEEFSDDELIAGVRQGVRDMVIAPVFCGSAAVGIGSYALLKGIADYMPSPDEAAVEVCEDEKGELIEIACTPNGSTSALVFKTTTDQYGRFSFFKVMSGTVKQDMALVNKRADANEKMSHIFSVCGKKTTEVPEVGCGDIGAVSKLVTTKTGDTLSMTVRKVQLDGIELPPPCYSQGIAPKVKGTEEKISAGLLKLRDEDPSFDSYFNPETKQHIISGAGDIHLDVLCSKLKNKFGVEVELTAPVVPYREKIRKKVSVEGKHKKQSGGHGQYGHVKMDFEPYAEGDFLFEEKIFGGSVPKNFHPAVEKGIREAMEHGVLAGYPMVGLKAVLTDGSYHDVDSNELSFKMAARLAYKAGIPQASPVILEPICSMKVVVPDSYMGDVIGDLNKRRGRIMGMNPTDDGQQEILAEAPMAELSDYAITLRSMTQGRGSFTSQFERYDEAPVPVQEKIIAESKDRLADNE